LSGSIFVSPFNFLVIKMELFYPLLIIINDVFANAPRKHHTNKVQEVKTARVT